MALGETAELIVQLKLQDQLTSGVAKVKSELNATADQIKSRFEGLGKDIQKGIGIGLGIGVAQVTAQAIGQVKDFVAGSITAFREEEQSIARLTASLKANAEGWDENVAAVEKHIQANTAAAFSDDDLRQSLGSLVAATHDVNKAFEDQALAIDLARFSGKSLEEATQTIIAVEAGRFRGLAQLGISIKGITTSEEALNKIREVTAGQSEAFLATDAGKAEKLNIAMNELAESFGRFASGPAADGAEVLTAFINTLNGAPFASESQQAADGITKLAGAIATMTEAEIDAAIAAKTIDLTKALGDPVIEQGLRTQIFLLKGAKAGYDETAGGVADFSTGLDKAGSTIDDLSTASRDARHDIGGLGADIHDTLLSIGGGADTAALKVQTLVDALLAIPTSVDSTVRVSIVQTVSGVGAGATDQPLFTAGESGAHGDAETPTERRLRLQREREQAAADAARKAKQAAEELARAYAEKVSNAYDKAKRASDFLFDALHERHLKAIHDAEALAQKQHDNAVDQIEDALKVAKAQNALAVNQAQQQQDSISRARTLRDLRENLADSLAALAKNPNDVGAQRGVRGAREALADFNAQQNIAALQSVQAAKDKAAEAAAQLARDQADADLEAAKLKATAAEQLANKADAKQKQQFDLALEALKKKDIGDPAKFLVDVKALQAKFGIFSDERGFQHIGDVVAGALKNVVIPTPHITLNTTPSFILKLGPVELKGIAAAVASTANPSQAGSTRTGQSQPRPT